MIKKILSIVLLLCSVQNIIAQKIGINTELPIVDLHLNGTLQITKDFNVGGSNTFKGDPGKEGQILVSKGANQSPEWVSLIIPVVPKGSYTMTNSNVLVDTQGMEMLNGVEKRDYYENDDLYAPPPNTDSNAKWIVFDQLTTTIIIKKTKNKTNLTLQSIAHLPMDGLGKDPKFTFAIGYFIDNKLKAVKPFGVSGTNAAFEIVTLVSTLEDLPIGSHQLKVAAIPRLKQNINYGMTLGKPNPKAVTSNNLINNLSPFMTNTSLQIDTFEVLN